jgi:hypothetical protein
MLGCSLRVESHILEHAPDAVSIAALQHLFAGIPRGAEDVDVARHLALCARRRCIGISEGLGVRYGDGSQGADPPRVPGRDHPGHNGSPVVSHEVDRVGAELVAHVEHVSDEVVDSVRVYRCGTGSGRVPALVGCDAPVAG